MSQIQKENVIKIQPPKIQVVELAGQVGVKSSQHEYNRMDGAMSQQPVVTGPTTTPQPDMGCSSAEHPMYTHGKI